MAKDKFWSKLPRPQPVPRTRTLAAQYRRIASLRGKQKALVAVGHPIVRIVYYLLTRQESYQDLGGNYFDERERLGVERRLVNRLERLGYKVSLESTAVA